MDNYYMMGQAAYQDATNAGSSPEDAAQTAGDMMSQGLADAGFPPEMIQAGMDAGIANYADAIADGMGPADAFSQAANIGMDAGAQVFDDQMPDMDEIGMTAFQDAIASGAPPAEATPFPPLAGLVLALSTAFAPDRLPAALRIPLGARVASRRPACRCICHVRKTPIPSASFARVH